ncbi:MAG: hypothetical protein HYV28_16960 [Ignavibacteriales bacterium]|nr:hypothetical protein [Ignavibacteriales bacterium]
MNFYYHQFLRRTAIILVVLLVIFLAAFNFGYISRDMLTAIITAKLINSLNYLAGMQIHVKALQKDQSYFMIYVFGGMTIRIFILLALIIISYKLLNLNFYSFILVFFGFYIFFLSLEIYYLLKFEHRKPVHND